MDGTTAAAISPTPDGGWEQTGEVQRFKLLRKTALTSLVAIADTTARTVPITTTQDILGFQFISDSIPPQVVTGTFSYVSRVFESATTANITLALVVRVLSSDGGTIRGTLFSNFNQDTEWPLSASAATRIVNAQSVTALTTQPGDRLVVEIGGHAAGPTAATSYTMRFGDNNASDFALTTALTTDLNPWCEFSQNIWSSDFNNYQFVKADNGMSVSEKIR